MTSDSLYIIIPAMKEKLVVGHDHYIVTGLDSTALITVTGDKVEGLIGADNIEAAQGIIEDIADKTGATNLTAISLNPEESGGERKLNGRRTFGLSGAWKSCEWKPAGPRPNYVVSPQKPGHA